MADWNLVGWLLDFNFLEADEFTLFDLKYKLTLDHVFLALFSFTLD